MDCLRYFTHRVHGVTAGAIELVYGGIRMGLTLGLMYAVLKGKNWARWLFVTLLAITLLMTCFSLLQRVQPVLMCLALYLSLTLYALVGSRSVKAYFSAIRHSPSSPTPPPLPRTVSPSDSSALQQ